MPARIDKLTEAQRAQMDAWADKWIEIGLRTGAMDYERFCEAAKACYGYAKIPWHGNVVRVSSPLVLALAAPIADTILASPPNGRHGGAVHDAVGDAVSVAVRDAVGDAVGVAVRDAVGDAVGVAVHDAVGDAVSVAVRDAVGDAVSVAVRVAVGDAVHDAVGDAVRVAVGVAVHDAVGVAVRVAVRVAVSGAVRGAVDGAVGGAVHSAVDGAVDGAVRGAVRDAVGDAVHDAVRDAVGDAVGKIPPGKFTTAIGKKWHRILGGQFWVSGWYWGTAWTSYFREVCGLDLPGDTWDRARAYEATTESACWWWPHHQFLMVCERPMFIHRELADPQRPRGWGSHRLHCSEGPAIQWPDGWGVWSWHGVRVTRQTIEFPETLTGEQILKEPNAEVRRVMIECIGYSRFLELTKAKRTQADDYGTLYRIDLTDDEPVVLVEVVNSTPERDGSSKKYVLRVPPDIETARAAVAWTFAKGEEVYAPTVQT